MKTTTTLKLKTLTKAEPDESRIISLNVCVRFEGGGLGKSPTRSNDMMFGRDNSISQISHDSIRC
jgi:hypothetical protein